MGDIKLTCYPADQYFVESSSFINRLVFFSSEELETEGIDRLLGRSSVCVFLGHLVACPASSLSRDRDAVCDIVLCIVCGLLCLVEPLPSLAHGLVKEYEGAV